MYLIRILTTSRNHTFISSRSLQRAFWKLYECDKRVFSLGCWYTKRYIYRTPTRSVLYVAKRIFTISFTLSIRGPNLCESRSRMYRRSVSSSTGVNQYRPLYLSAKEIMPFIRLRNELSGRSYIFTARQIDIFLVVRIASITRVILVFLNRVDILYIYRNDVWRKEVVM